jgi:hypothetical protein
LLKIGYPPSKAVVIQILIKAATTYEVDHGRIERRSHAVIAYSGAFERSFQSQQATTFGGGLKDGPYKGP